ncbi:hypothetical protein KFL_000090630 [Klebsormidium nitens]|uniref:Uncharacterized protein n=1 Tax=Klebsormidium nitens TaxID=105231 RepID=A0A1Y1HNT4_KLENI|nr:hypothetical protein KFL_000090630 [Klebsormidium nitens]|eukprot:GAQ78217.1 hypothetical protein KFL_000090630 [Klebsormidium nitens]
METMRAGIAKAAKTVKRPGASAIQHLMEVVVCGTSTSFLTGGSLGMGEEGALLMASETGAMRPGRHKTNLTGGRRAGDLAEVHTEAGGHRGEVGEEVGAGRKNLSEGDSHLTSRGSVAISLTARLDEAAELAGVVADPGAECSTGGVAAGQGGEARLMSMRGRGMAQIRAGGGEGSLRKEWGGEDGDLTVRGVRRNLGKGAMGEACDNKPKWRFPA